jgi:hypothetical protein
LPTMHKERRAHTHTHTLNTSMQRWIRIIPNSSVHFFTSKMSDLHLSLRASRGGGKGCATMSCHCPTTAHVQFTVHANELHHELQDTNTWWCGIVSFLWSRLGAIICQHGDQVEPLLLEHSLLSALGPGMGPGVIECSPTTGCHRSPRLLGRHP